MVYIAGEEMTHYTMNLIVEKWVEPYFDTSKWQHFDLSCISRDKTNDQVLLDAVEAGKQVGAIFKEPTITPNAVQVEEMGLSKAFGSPNGAMRKGWNGITISRGIPSTLMELNSGIKTESYLKGMPSEENMALDGMRLGREL